MSHRIFLLTVFVAFTVTTCTAAAFNYFIDPYGLFGSTISEKLNAIKPSSVTRMRMVKPYQVLRRSPGTLIAGNSRPEMGIDPQSACWSQEFQPVYNLSIPGSHVYLQTRYIQHALETGTVRHIYLGIDFLAFLQHRVVGKDSYIWPDSPWTFESRMAVERNGSANRVYLRQKTMDYLSGLFSLEAVVNSIKTISAQKDPKSITRTESGFNPANEYLEIIENEGQEVLFRHKNAGILAEFSDPELELLESDSNWSLQLESIKRLLDLASSKGIRITLFINPYHAEYLTAIELGKKWPIFEEWKRIMVKLTERYDDVALWDFNEFNAFAIERPPARGETGTTLRWFWEPAHYSKDMGELMLANMLNTECASPNKQMVGSILTEKTIEEHLQKLHSAMDQYKKDFPDVIDRLAAIRGQLPLGIERE